jgi:Lrp/AsnC family leucine-responsive transcriptional regulator
MDKLDQRILDCLQRDASMTNQALADQVGLSPSACLKRVKRLRESGVIDRVVALLNLEAIGACIHLIVEVTMERDHKKLYQRFEEKVTAAPEVKQCYQVTGESDYVLIVSVPDLDAYDKFCDDVLYADDNMRKFRTLISRKRSKFDTSTYIDLERGKGTTNIR